MMRYARTWGRALRLLAGAMPTGPHARWRLTNLVNVMRGVWPVLRAATVGVALPVGTLHLKVLRRDGRVDDLGLVSTRVITTVGVGFLVDAWQNLTELENMRFHGFGTGVTAESSAQTALVTELTTQYSVDNTRPTGTLAEGASANIFRSVATTTPDSGGVLAITEHGLFSQAATGGGVMWDRSLFAAVNLDTAQGDSLQATYEATFPAGG